VSQRGQELEASQRALEVVLGIAPQGLGQLGGCGLIGNDAEIGRKEMGEKLNAIVRHAHGIVVLRPTPLAHGAADGRAECSQGGSLAAPRAHPQLRVVTGDRQKLDRERGDDRRRSVCPQRLEARHQQAVHGRCTLVVGSLTADESALDAMSLPQDELHVTVLRPSAIYGPRDREILIFFKPVAKGVLPLTNPLEARYSMIYGPDCAEACIRALEAETPSGGVYYLDDGVPVTFAEMIQAVEEALGAKAWMRLPLPRPVVLGAALLSETYGRVTNQAVMFTRDKCNELFHQWVCDGSRARDQLAWAPRVQFFEGVKLTAAWYRQAGWL
jgi:hypothetical protein